MTSRVTRDHHTWTRDTIKNVSGDVTLDLVNDLTIDVAGGQVTIIDDAGSGDPDLIIKSTHASTTQGPSLVLQCDEGNGNEDNDILGNISFIGKNSDNDEYTFAVVKGSVLDASDDSELGKLELQVTTENASANIATTGLTLTGSSTNDEVDVTVGAGAASMTTIAGDLDIDGDTITSVGALEIDPGGALSITGQDVNIDATKKLYLDGGTDTYIYESSSDVIRFVCGDSTRLNISSTQSTFAGLVAIASGEKLHFDGGGIGVDTYIHEVSADKLEFVVGADEILTLDEANQRVTLEVDRLVYKIGSGGVEFSATDSAYAGMILGYTVIGLDETPASYTVTNAMVPTHDDHKVSFVFPPSGKVEIFASIYVDTVGALPLTFGLSTTNNTTGFTSLGAKYENSTYNGDETDREQHTHRWYVTGTAGDAEELWFSAGTTRTGTRYVLRWGGDSSSVSDESSPYEYQPFVMKAIALPSTIYTG